MPPPSPSRRPYQRSLVQMARFEDPADCAPIQGARGVRTHSFIGELAQARRDLGLTLEDM